METPIERALHRVKASDVNNKTDDVIQNLIDRIFRLNASYEEKMRRLEALEPVIEEAYALGRTQVKPVRLMTADDIDLDIP